MGVVNTPLYRNSGLRNVCIFIAPLQELAKYLLGLQVELSLFGRYFVVILLGSCRYEVAWDK
jgi:hypothetical protein